MNRFIAKHEANTMDAVSLSLKGLIFIKLSIIPYYSLAFSEATLFNTTIESNQYSCTAR